MKKIESVISSHGFEELFAVSLHTRERNTVLHNVQSCNRRRAAEWSRVHDCERPNRATVRSTKRGYTVKEEAALTSFVFPWAKAASL